MTDPRGFTTRYERNELGDALQWTRIAALNGDPRLMERSGQVVRLA